MLINNKSCLVVIKEAQVFEVDELTRKLEVPITAIRRMKEGREVAPAFLEAAESDLKQIIFLLKGAKELIRGKNKKASQSEG